MNTVISDNDPALAERMVRAEIVWTQALANKMTSHIATIMGELRALRHPSLTVGTLQAIETQLQHMWPTPNNPGALALGLQVVIASDKIILAFLDNRNGIEISPRGNVRWTNTDINQMTVLGRFTLTGPLPPNAPIGGSFTKLHDALQRGVLYEIDPELVAATPQAQAVADRYGL